MEGIMNKEFYDVKEFHKAFNYPHPDKPTLLTGERALTRKSWMDEELGEFIEATENGDIVEQADAMIDVLYHSRGNGYRTRKLICNSTRSKYE